ncbi:MAG: sialate O-acetylesterase [Chitinophagaceae bacterium]
MINRHMKKTRAIQTAILCSFILALALPASAQVKLPQLVRDSMVLQRDTKINIWGWAAAKEKITVSFNKKKYRTATGADGKWQVQLPAMPAGGPYTMEITGSNTIVLKEILVGDVWFCSGQSNMVHQLNIHDVTYANDIATANYPQIRQFWIPTLTSLEGIRDNLPTGYWKAAVAEDVRPFSAVAYFFARKIHEKYKVPIGLINASVGGSPIEAWMSEEGLRDFSSQLAAINKNRDTAYVNETNRRSFAAAAAGQRDQPQDKGLTGPQPWYAMDYAPKEWRMINIPGYWEDQGIRDLNGVVWYRREIYVPAAMTGKPAKVFLGRIVDADVLYINGQQVGATTYLYPQRRYAVPAGLLKPGKNVFVIKVINNFGKGGFVPDKPYCLFAGNDTIDLKGSWQYKVGAVYQSRPGVPGIAAQNQPAALYNAMVAPVINYAIKGMLWYQGESNAGRPQDYEKLQKALIADWRGKWKQADLPFLYVQLPNFMEVNYLPEESNWALLREAQLKALSEPNTAIAVAIDLGEWNDIHPDNKKDVGERLALAADKLAYGAAIVYSGPLYESAVIEGNKIRISFRHTGSGLIASDGEPLGEFAIAGGDKKFVWAHATIEGGQVVVWSESVTAPKYVRYAWADNPANPNLYNKEGLPASPFRTDK